MVPNLLDHILIVLLGMVMPVAAVFGGQRQMKGIKMDTLTKINIYWSNSLLLSLAAGAVLFAWWWNERFWDDLGFAGPYRSGSKLGFGLALGLVVAYLLDAWLQVNSPERLAKTQRRWKRDTPFLPQKPREMAHFTVVALSAGICEEIVFRGYFISYLTFFTGRTETGLAIAVLTPALIFGFSHLYQGIAKVLKIVVLAALFGAIFVLTGSLWLPIVVHVLIDLAGGFFGVWLLPDDQE